MRIRKFYEAEDLDQISPESLQTIITKLSNTISTIDNHRKDISSSLNTLSNFKSKSKSSNTQIDDSCANLETVDSKLDETINLLDTVLKNLKDYNDSGEKYLY